MLMTMHVTRNAPSLVPLPFLMQEEIRLNTTLDTAFVHPGTGMKAMDTEMVTFSSFDEFCHEHAEDLKHHNDPMYCTSK
jgi:hypothetical protein